MDEKYYVLYKTDPARCVGHGIAPKECNLELDPLFDGTDKYLDITEQQYNEIAESDEPSKIVAKLLNLPYQKCLPKDKMIHSINVVEIAALPEEQSSDQPCRFANRVEGHATYCHNDEWIDSPRKCRRTVDGSSSAFGWPVGHKCFVDCPGFEANVKYHKDVQTENNVVG